MIGTIARCCMTVALLISSAAASAQPLKALLLTTQGVYHDYERQTTLLTEGLARQINIRFDVSLAELDRWRGTDFGEGYDVIVYNICMADNTDGALIANLRRQTEQLGIPAIVLHCTMHSFRETDQWWPLYGLKTTAHDPLGVLETRRVLDHPVLNGIPQNWTLASDELYINLAFDAEGLLEARGEDGADHVVAWLTSSNGTNLFGTTAGHSDETMADPLFHRLVANGILFVTGNLTATGDAAPGLQAQPVTDDVVRDFSAPSGVRFLDDAGRRCVFRKLAVSAGPCFIGCWMHPLKWGEAADACRQECELELPSHAEAIAQCQAEDA